MPVALRRLSPSLLAVMLLLLLFLLAVHLLLPLCAWRLVLLRLLRLAVVLVLFVLLVLSVLLVLLVLLVLCDVFAALSVLALALVLRFAAKCHLHGALLLLALWLCGLGCGWWCCSRCPCCPACCVCSRSLRCSSSSSPGVWSCRARLMGRFAMSIDFGQRAAEPDAAAYSRRPHPAGPFVMLPPCGLRRLSL